MSNVVRFPKIPVSPVSRTPGLADRLPHKAGLKRAVSLNSHRADLIRWAIDAITEHGDAWVVGELAKLTKDIVESSTYSKPIEAYKAKENPDARDH